jgi:hypothetical protein
MAGDEEPTPKKGFRRDPGGPFDDYRLETYAKSRAKGGSVASSGVAAGVTKHTALRWEATGEMRSRVRELREGAEDFVGVSKAWILAEYKKNVDLAREQGAIKASNDALACMYKILAEDKNVAHQMASAKLPATLEGKELQRALLASFSEPETVRRDDRPVIDVKHEESDDAEDS